MLSATNRRYTFLTKFLQSPGQIGSVTPSSSFLTKKMFENVDWNEIDLIVELGAGTGVFTEYISLHKKTATKAVIIEKDDEMRSALKRQYPSFHFGTEAEDLAEFTHERNCKQVDCIISGLPFANFSPAEGERILQASLRTLKPGGLFIAFQYSLQMKKMLERHFHEVTIEFVPFNLPPAFVYTCKKIS